MDVRAHWRGRERYTVFDTHYGMGDRVRALQEAWRADPERPGRLHIVALAEGMLPGFHRIPQDDARLTLTLLAAPPGTALAQLGAQPDYVYLHGVTGLDFVRPLARIAAAGARLHAEGASEEQRAALQAQGFVFDDAGGHAVFASRKPRLPVAAVPERRAIVIGAGLAGSAACASLCARGWQVALVERHPAPAMEASGNLA
ncbi:MAG: tRNA U-34 5-methylaminomethyl-2-thiouridine biosynthesis protein, partial [Lysobacteraceae bacterium]